MLHNSKPTGTAICHRIIVIAVCSSWTFRYDDTILVFTFPRFTIFFPTQPAYRGIRYLMVLEKCSSAGYENGGTHKIIIPESPH